MPATSPAKSPARRTNKAMVANSSARQPAVVPIGDSPWPGIVEYWSDTGARQEEPAAAVGLVLVCEHASNRLADPWNDLGLSPAEMRAHIAWDPGALGVARGLAARLSGRCGGAVLVHAPLSRLIYDLNRSPDRSSAMPDRSESYDIPANRNLAPADRARRTRTLYTPFHGSLHAVVTRQMALGCRPAVITVHSFTPIFDGRQRDVELGIIHDADPSLSLAILAEAEGCGLVTRLNEPYSAADHVTHTLRLQATPYGLPNSMLELRNDLIADAAAEEAMATRLAPVVGRALDRIGEAACRAS